MSKRCFDLARTAGVSFGGACGVGFKILDRTDKLDKGVFRMIVYGADY
ncbi:MAG: hypothetical protein R6U13_07470 [Desulfatiglandaceae bacterium]